MNGLGLDLTLRDRSDGRITLDDFMRALWQQFGKSGERVPGYVEKPYAMADLRNTLASVSGDAAFAADFFARYIQGHDVVDYARLLRRAGLVLRQRNPGAPFAGDLRLQGADGGVRVMSPVPAGSPWYDLRQLKYRCEKFPKCQSSLAKPWFSRPVSACACGH